MKGEHHCHTVIDYYYYWKDDTKSFKPIFFYKNSPVTHCPNCNNKLEVVELKKLKLGFGDKI